MLICKNYPLTSRTNLSQTNYFDFGAKFTNRKLLYMSGLLLGNCFRARRTGNGQNRDGRRGVRGSVAVPFFKSVLMRPILTRLLFGKHYW